MLSFSNRSQFKDYVKTNFLSERLDSDAAAALAEALVDLFQVDVDKSRNEGGWKPGFGLLLPGYAIRDDDLKFFDSFKSGFLALASVQFFSESPTASAIAGFGLSIATLIRSAVKKGVMISVTQFRLLSTIKSHGFRMHTDEILEARNRLASIEGDSGPWNREQLLAMLSDLSAMAAGDGTVLQLVSQDGDGLWGVVDL